ncbi:protein NUCLEAR FUSION DEFECTIVE 4-like [Mangifera indica]|uniref:protein NUCLEAR FUSION DEFECTIVE 4-like n=1 Tax=Mangifera indica TaxID=29780 RepID=UPI001CFBF7ED|nr:protein NUCLEAR FUSION DEFECTIVE 4-like [Mangifera indica]
MPKTFLQWLSLVGAVWLQSINGTNTNFPAYSSQLKALLSMSQLQLNNLAFASDAGKLLGWIPGIAAVYLPLWLVLMIGAFLGLIGYGLQYLFITHQISSLSYGYIFLLTVVAGNSICWINTVCYVVTIRNFPINRQVAVGITTSYLGLSAKVYTDIVDGLYSSPTKRAKSYLLLNSILPLLACGIACPLIRVVKVEKSKRMRYGFIVMFAITIVTGIYAIIGSFNWVTKILSPLKNMIGMVVCLLVPLVIPFGEKIRDVLATKWRINGEPKVHNSTIEENMSAVSVENGVKEDEGDVTEIDVMEEIGVNSMVKRVEFWLYFFVYLFGATLGLVFLNNLGQIAESRGFSSTSSLVSLSSSFGFFGRLLPSLCDYFFSRSKYMISSTGSIVASMAPMAGAFMLLLNRTDVALYISTATIGVCTGAITSLSVATTTELFGAKNFSLNHNVLVANIPIGSFLYGYLAAFVYHREGNGQGTCIGMDCYRNTFIFWGFLCFFGTFLALILYFRTRKFYTQRHIRRYTNMV